MKVHLDQDFSGDFLLGHGRGPLSIVVDVPESTVARWREAVRVYHEVQMEMACVWARTAFGRVTGEEWNW